MKYQTQVRKKARCARCGKRLKRGGLKYNIKIQVVSDFDGYLEDYSKKPQDYLEKQLLKLEKDLNDKTEEELSEDVYIEKSLLTCERCRDWFVGNLKEFEG